MLLSACGLDCEKCEFFNNQCNGCYVVNGKTFWAVEHLDAKVCPIYDCSLKTKKLDSCAKCSDLPCQIFWNLKDPNITEEEHKQSMIVRVNNLKGSYQ